jgi:protein TonB
VSVLSLDPYAPDGRETTLWSVAALVVAAAHVGIVAAYMLLRPVPEEQATAPVIDVAFMPATSMPAPSAPDAPPAEPTPPVEQSHLEPPKDEPVTPPEAVAEPQPPEQAEPVPQPEPAPPTVALTTPEPSPDKPKTEMAKPEQTKPVALPERPAHKPVKNDKAEKEKHRAAPPKPAAAPASRPARMAAAPNAGVDSEGARAGQASWNSELAAHIRRYAAYPADGGGASGTVQVSVNIDRNGRLLSHRLGGSSGSPPLDRAAMTIIERAQPFPHFPPGMTQAHVTRTIPLHLRPR